MIREVWQEPPATHADGTMLRYPWRQCEATDRVRVREYSYVMERCGADAGYGMTWEGFTEGKHTAVLCARHVLLYIGPLIVEQKEKS